MDIEYTQRLKKIEAELDKWLPSAAGAESSWREKIFPGIGEKIKPAALEALFTPLNDIISRGGKRWRPLLMTLICETLGGGDNAVPLAPLVEFCHNASLIHDDIEDDSDKRRDKPAIHTIYGVDTAINSGAFFYFFSLCCIESSLSKDNALFSDNALPKELIFKLWAQYMRKLHLGQSIDINWHREIKIIPEIEEYYLMCGLKTGSLSRFAAELGAYAAGAGDEAARTLGEAAEKLGIGFQILDDVKNLTTGIPGKKRGEDIVEGKKSLPVLLYLHRYPEKRELIFYYFYEAKINGFAAPEVKEMIDTLNDCSVLKEAEEKAVSIIKETRTVFNSPQFAGFPANEKGRSLLNGLIDFISQPALAGI